MMMNALRALLAKKKDMRDDFYSGIYIDGRETGYSFFDFESQDFLE